MNEATLHKEALSAATAFLSAFDRLSWPEFSAYLAPEVTVFMPFPDIQHRLNGKDEVERVFSKFFENVRQERSGPAYLAINPVDLDLNLIGNVALVTFHLDNGHILSRRTAIFEKKPESWQLIHLHASNLPLENGV